MTGIPSAALRVEMRKAAGSVVVRAATALIAAGVTAMSLALTLAAAAGNEEVAAQLGDLAGSPGGAVLTGVAAQIVAAGGLIGFGVTISWVFGREFAEGTIDGLFALPVSRSTIAVAKLLTYGLWALVVAVVTPALLGAAGLVARLESPDGGWLPGLTRIGLLVALTALLAVPAAWAATLGRGLLAGITVTVGIVVVAQITVIAGGGAWFPLAAPGLWAVSPGEVAVQQLALVPMVSIVFGTLVTMEWRRLQLDR